MDLTCQCRIEKARSRQDVERFLQAVQLVGVALWLVGKGLGGRDEQIELFFRHKAQGVQVVVFDERKGQWAEGLSFPDAQRQEVIVVGARLIPRHGRPS